VPTCFRGTPCAPPVGADTSPADVGGLLKSFRGEQLRCAKGQLSQRSARMVEGIGAPRNGAWTPTPPLQPVHAQGFTSFERNCVGPKAHVHVCQARKPVLDGGARVHPKMWPRTGMSPFGRLFKGISSARG
jgi:hypothetical protein